MFKIFTEQFTTHFEQQQKLTLNDLFDQEPQRYLHYQASAAGLTLDFCRQPVTAKTLALLDKFYEQTTLQQKITAMFSGEKINTTENQAALHVALRGSHHPDLTTISKQVATELHKMQTIVQRLHQKAWRGASGAVITDVVNIGIGGSDLGPRMVVQALQPYHYGDIKVHFVANVDGADIYETLKQLNPASTLFIIASKSFKTQETLLNAETAKTWLRNQLKTTELTSHFIGITAQPERAIAWGIAREHLFEMWNFVGGRYSLWSSIGLPIAIQIGMEHFHNLLNGAHELDQHFLSARPSQNLPILLGFLGIMNQNFYGAQSHAILPYNQYLQLFPMYLQQADMESNGKSVSITGQQLDYQTGVVLWGGVETNGQHSFHQLLHQGSLHIPVDFIIALQAAHTYPEHQNALIANCLAQAEALRQGNDATHPPLAKRVPGNRPSNIIFMEQLTPKTLGALIAMYEHKIFIQSLTWDINAFDQWGVELGKQLTEKLLPAIQQLSHPCVKSLAELLIPTH
jgi:glucose-6-phosphate isomerase